MLNQHSIVKSENNTIIRVFCKYRFFRRIVLFGQMLFYRRILFTAPYFTTMCICVGGWAPIVRCGASHELAYRPTPGGLEPSEGARSPRPGVSVVALVGWGGLEAGKRLSGGGMLGLSFLESRANSPRLALPASGPPNLRALVASSDLGRGPNGAKAPDQRAPLEPTYRPKGPCSTKATFVAECRAGPTSA